MEAINWNYHKNDKFSLPNQQIITDWINHSNENNYELIFSFIPHEDKKINHYKKLEQFVKSQGVKAYNFQEYLDEKSIIKSDIYWENDGHFNVYGNKIYADFLLEKL